LPILNRAQLFALAILLAALVVAIVPPALAMLAWANAARELADADEVLDRLQAAHRAGGKAGGADRLNKAPDAAFLTADTAGLATARLQTYLADLARASHANLVSSNVLPPDRDGATDMIGVQTNLDIDYEALQTFLYKLEAGSPYAFVDSLKLRLAEASHKGAAQETTMNAILTVKAIWRRSAT
jgi:hypothetical protein